MPVFAGLRIPRPVVPSHYDVPPIPRQCYCNAGKTCERPELYENVPAASITRDEDFVVYHPNYENAEIRSERRRDSCETYQNVTLIDEEASVAMNPLVSLFCSHCT